MSVTQALRAPQFLVLGFTFLACCAVHSGPIFHMVSYAVLARDYFGQAIMGTVFGAATMLSSIGMALGPLAGGWVFDTLGDYAWLFIGSAAVGLGAVAVAFAFPPQSRLRLQPA